MLSKDFFQQSTKSMGASPKGFLKFVPCKIMMYPFTGGIDSFSYAFRVSPYNCEICWQLSEASSVLMSKVELSFFGTHFLAQIKEGQIIFERNSVPGT